MTTTPSPITRTKSTNSTGVSAANRRFTLAGAVALAVAAFAAAFAAAPPAALAAGPTSTLQCEGVYDSGTFDHVEVAPGAACILLGVTVTGSVTAISPHDVVLSGVDIGGNVEILDAAGDAVVLNAGTHVSGNVAVVGGAGLEVILLGSCASGGINVDGNVTVEDTGTIFATATNCSEFGGNLRVRDNVVEDSEGTVQTVCSDVGGNLDWSANTATYLYLAGDCSRLGDPRGGDVGGNISYEDNVGTDLEVLFFATPGNITVAGNSATGAFPVAGNVVGGNLTCRGNDATIETVVPFPDGTSDSFPNDVTGRNTCDN